MNLKEDLLASVLYDFKQPTLVQKRSIKACIEERDVIIDAPSGALPHTCDTCSNLSTGVANCTYFLGTGKTTLAAICILQQIKLNVDECQAIILVPTMESAIKVSSANRSSRRNNMSYLTKSHFRRQKFYCRWETFHPISNAISAIKTVAWRTKLNVTSKVFM